MNSYVMKHIRAIIYIGILCLLVACSCNGSKHDAPKQEPVALIQEDAIPAGAIPFHYFNDSLKMILIDAVLNGTDSIAVMWDTGHSNMEIPTAYEDSLKGKDSIHLKTGDFDLIYKGKIRFSDRHNSKKRKDRLVVGPDLFRDKIVEISYDRKYIRMLNNVDGLEGYGRIPYQMNKKDKHLYIPISVCVQGKVFRIEDALLDTGFNGAFVTNEKFVPGLDLSSAATRYGGAPGDQLIVIHGLMVDSIRTGNVSAMGMEIYIAPDKERIPNLLGNEFFSHFSVVFDFKNQNLYLKPLEK